MLNVRYLFRLIGAFFNRFKILIFLSIGFGIVIFFLLRFFAPLLGNGVTQRIGLTGRYTATNLPTNILKMVGSGLTKLTLNGSVEPDLAKSWETPDQGKTWIFTLKNNLFWQDDRPITSSSISYQFSDVTVERPDDRTIVFKLQNAYSAFPSVVSRPIFKKGLLGTGEWKVSKISVNGNFVEQLSLVKKTDEKTVYKFYPTEERTKIAFELGQVDLIENIFDPKPITSWSKVKIDKSSDMGEYVAVFFNTQDKFLSEKNLRQALSYAINKDALAEKRALSPISIDSWAYNSQVKPYNYDLLKAKTMIAEFKTALKIDNLTINLSTPPVLFNKAEQIAKDWQSAGVTVNLNVVSTIPVEYQAFLAIFDIPDDPDQYSIWHSTQTSTNITHYQNPRIDKLLEDGRSEISLEERKKIYLDFQRFILEDAPAAFLYYPTNYTISRK